jgi:hypothetical protein
MSYYIYPKANPGEIQLETGLEPALSHLSPSLTRYLCDLYNQIQSRYPEYYNIQNEVHPYFRGILSNGPADAFYEIAEIMYTMRLNHYLDNSVSKNVQILNIGTYSNAVYYSRKSLNRNDINMCNLSFKMEEYLGAFQKIQVVFADYISDVKTMIQQLCAALACQSKKGILIWKIGDCFTEIMLDIIYFVSSFYQKIYFIKPTIMDISKSEKYIVCKGFTPPDNYIDRLFYLSKSVNESSGYIYRILRDPIPYFFSIKLEEMNYIFGQSQLEQIHYLVLLMNHKYKNDKIQNLAKVNMLKCSEWLSRFRFFT